MKNIEVWGMLEKIFFNRSLTKYSGTIKGNGVKVEKPPGNLMPAFAQFLVTIANTNQTQGCVHTKFWNHSNIY